MPQAPLSLEQELAGESEPLTQFGHALSELGIEHIAARSAQAKGRIERLWQTFQDRLLIELRIRQVCTLEEANAVLDELVAKHNQQFAVLPQDSESAYRPIPQDMPLTHVLCLRETRVVTPAQTLSYHGTIYRIEAGAKRPIPARTAVQVRKSMQDELLVYHEGICYPLHPVASAPRVIQATTEKSEERKAHKPSADHPWRNYKKPLDHRSASK